MESVYLSQDFCYANNVTIIMLCHSDIEVVQKMHQKMYEKGMGAKTNHKSSGLQLDALLFHGHSNEQADLSLFSKCSLVPISGWRKIVQKFRQRQDY